MKQNKYPQDQDRKPDTIAGQPTAPGSSQNEANYTPSSDEVARKAYFTYVNQGSKPEHEVQHWLQAGAELLAERKLTRVHGSHKHS
ncbi:MAG TPA: DUF2934 domain-containing protein [Verrucomicrobiae bacterium]|jgi:hypothetical protein|nr:DUF2934 domain-containing protein [Verrucomicrobiae bacterium]